MNRILTNNALLFVLMVFVGLGYSACQKTSNGGSSPSPTPTEELKSANGIKPLPGIAAADTAMIIRVEKDVSLKAKGAPAFVRILYGVFRAGDTLQVGEQSKAWVECPDHSLCPLEKGLYAECCREVCDSGIRIPPPANTTSQARVMFISKNELPPSELKIFQLQETRIRNLGANEVTTQFLIADLYSSWKLVEAKDEVNNLSWRLAKPETKQELKMLYAPMWRRTGDLQLMIKQQPEAEDSYKKAIELGWKTNDPLEKAEANVSLGEFYEMSGNKDKAVIHLKQGVQLYEKGGDVKKAAATREALSSIEKL